MTRIDDTVTYLEMFERPPPRQLPVPLGKLALMRAEACPVSFYRYLYETVGTPWVWFERRLMSDKALAAELAKPTTEVFVLHVGGVPAGYFELNAAEPHQTKLCYFAWRRNLSAAGSGRFCSTRRSSVHGRARSSGSGCTLARSTTRGRFRCINAPVLSYTPDAGYRLRTRVRAGSCRGH